MQWINFHLLWIPIYLISVVGPITGQFKIVNLNDAHPSNGTTGSVNFVQIKPILTANGSTPTELPTTRTNETARTLQPEMVENKFIKLSIVNSTTLVGNKTRERKSQQAMRTNARQNELPAGDWSKTDRPLLNSEKLATVVGYAKRSKIRSTSRTAMVAVNSQEKQSSTLGTPEPMASKVRRHEYRNFKSRCRCERIWNCVRIQISVARCAPDYFMCCF